MAIPSYQDLMLPVLTLTAEGRERVPEMLDPLARRFALTEEEKAQTIPSGKQSLLANRAHWSRYYMYRAGLVEPIKRGSYRISERGRTILARNPELITNEDLAAS